MLTNLAVVVPVVFLGCAFILPRLSKKQQICSACAALTLAGGGYLLWQFLLP